MARRDLPFANAFFFPAAAAYGAVAVSGWVLTLEGVLPCIPGWCAATAHAREMLFGYAFAVVAGFLLGPQPLRTILALLFLWLGARIAFLAAPGSWLVLFLDTTFITAATGLGLARYAPSAKTWRNRALSAVIAGLGLSGAMGGLAFSLDAIPLRLTSDAALVLFATLLFFMGGRMIAPAVRGHVVRGGGRLEAGVQPQLEGAVLVCLFGTLAVVLLGREAPGVSGPIAAALLGVAGALCLVRLLCWRPWLCRTRLDLLMLMLGYGWLAIGLLLLAAARLALLPTSLRVRARGDAADERRDNCTPFVGLAAGCAGRSAAVARSGAVGGSLSDTSGGALPDAAARRSIAVSAWRAPDTIDRDQFSRRLPGRAATTAVAAPGVSGRTSVAGPEIVKVLKVLGYLAARRRGCLVGLLPGCLCVNRRGSNMPSRVHYHRGREFLYYRPTA